MAVSGTIASRVSTVEGVTTSVVQPIGLSNRTPTLEIIVAEPWPEELAITVDGTDHDLTDGAVEYNPGTLEVWAGGSDAFEGGFALSEPRAHLTATALLDGTVLLVGGGIIPDEDIPELKAAGMDEIFGPGTDTGKIVEFITGNVRQ